MVRVRSAYTDRLNVGRLAAFIGSQYSSTAPAFGSTAATAIPPMLLRARTEWVNLGKLPNTLITPIVQVIHVMGNAFYDYGRSLILEGGLHYLLDTVKVALVSAGYSPNLGVDQYLSDVNAFVLGTPQSLVSKVDNRGTAVAADITFQSVTAGATVSYLLLYKDTGVVTTSPLIALFDTANGMPVGTSGGNIAVEWDGNGIFKV